MKSISITDLSAKHQAQVLKQIGKVSNSPQEPILSESNSSMPFEKESDLQREAERYLRKLKDCGRIIDFLHIRKAKGNKKGIPDLLIFLPFNKILYIELKRSSKEKLRDEQKKFIARATDLYTKVFVCWTMEDVINKVKHFLI